MVKGLDVFRRHFAPYGDRYVLIGGVAATLVMDEAGLDFRVTKDLDLLLVVEALDADFGQQFWHFVEAGGYQIRQRSEGRPELYRFQKPTGGSYPEMLELFSRAPGGLRLADGAHLTPLPIDEAVSSLSAILLDDDYYAFVLDGRRVAQDLTIIGEDRLIPLKANAWLDLKARKEAGAAIDSKVVKKHRNDALRLSQLLAPTQRVMLPPRVAKDLQRFLELLPREDIDPKSLGLGRVDLAAVVGRLRTIYGLAEDGALV